MNRDTDLSTRFPNASQSFLRLNGLLEPEAKEPRRLWTDEGIAALMLYYAKTPAEKFSLKNLASQLGRTEAAVALKASGLGYTMKRGRRPKSGAAKASMSAERKERFGTPEARTTLGRIATESHVKNGHPRGMLGKHHTQETKDAISKFHLGKKIPRERVEKALRTKVKNGTLHPAREGCTWKSGWVEIGGQKFYARSRWEANYGHYLEWLKSQGLVQAWRHEPTTFWFAGIKRGCMSYLPDFEVITTRVEFHEVKGWMDARSITKIRRMAKYHPQVILKVIDSTAYKALARSVSKIVPGWQ